MERESRQGQSPAARPPIIDRPEETVSQLRRLVVELEPFLAGNLIGIYLHGSLAMGCFNAQESDIDLLVVTVRRLSMHAKRLFVASLLALSGSPHPIEISVLCRHEIQPWHYPTPFDLHYGESWRARYEEVLASGGRLPPVGLIPPTVAPQTDTDLAAHVRSTRERGVVLSGEPVEAVFPNVPERDLLASLVSDLRWARRRLDTGEGLRYGVLNACRVCAYLREGRTYSKSEGARWALATLPRRYRPIIRTALESYQSAATAARRIARSGAGRLIDQAISEALREEGDS